MSQSRRILAEHAGRDSALPGEFIEVPVDLVLANDVTAPLAIKELERLGSDGLFDPEKVVMVLDHFTPNRDVASAEQCALIRRFAKKHSLKHFYDGGEVGIEHVLLPEEGLIRPGSLVIGADSHTCTYGALGAFAIGVGSTDVAAAMGTGLTWLRVPEAILVNVTGRFRAYAGGKDLILYLIGKLGVDGANYRSIEFTGDGLESLGVAGRLTVANMVIEAGAKNGLFPVDDQTVRYLAGVGVEAREGELEPDGAGYAGRIEIDLGELPPQVALPPLPSNSVPVGEAPREKLDQVVIGSCTNGRIEDLRLAAEILAGKNVAPGLRLIIIPGTPRVYRESMNEGLFDVFLDAGAIISPPTCGPCLGGHMGVLAAGEKALSTTNRNFVGRMGHRESEVYLCNPAVAAASAVTGRITDPGEIT
ncbi:MAG: 3-isopropylmalate dehydratase large subunit [Actinobacteria bacterium]|nr:3-isopropylmalate dehydratase large subunit [Actinomycetota bacterium]MBU4302238.1 3-isopropylmalate dehydratase large subunit [Actinomycetota bacterium]MBU4489907.1 3-isopropylmalate dehydratase large subunit [Actinomycetota bacterium]MCG2795505.1 3-isopropylmalate dehydratase large subunit [Actinomycetes bacterium]